MPSDTELTGLVMWALVFTVLFLIRRGCKRRMERVSRNATIGTKWEQDVPMTECFEEDDL